MSSLIIINQMVMLNLLALTLTPLIWVFVSGFSGDGDFSVGFALYAVMCADISERIKGAE